MSEPHDRKMSAHQIWVFPVDEIEAELNSEHPINLLRTLARH